MNKRCQGFPYLPPTCFDASVQGSAMTLTTTAPLGQGVQMAQKEQCIEPKMGATYGPSFEGEVAVYEYDEWPRSSVLYGRTRRTFLDCGTLEEMKAKYPQATVCVSSGYVEDSFNDLPDEDDMELAEHEEYRNEWRYSN